MKKLVIQRRGILMAFLLLAAAGWAGDDGEGTASLAQKELVAGSRVTLIVDFTVGPSGIPVGGGISLGLHHAAAWSAIQTTAANKSGYATVEGTSPGNFTLTWYGWIPSAMLADARSNQNHDGIFHRCLVAKVKNQALAPGEQVQITLGANGTGLIVHKSTDKDHEFRIMTDADGNNVYRGIAQSPRVDIVSAPATRLLAVVPSTIQAGESFEMQIRAEDPYSNMDLNYQGTVQVMDRAGQTVADDVAVSGGLKIIPLTIAQPELQCYRLSDGRLEGRSNPCRAFAQEPPFKIYWGDIHGHTTISDGIGNDPEEYFAFGRDQARLDVCALTDHGFFDWPATMAGVIKFYEPGHFVTLLAFEGGASSDHMNYYYRSDSAAHIIRWTQDYATLYDIVTAQYDLDSREIIIGPHHFTYHRGNPLYPFGLFDERVARFVEVYSVHGTSEYFGNPRPLAGTTEAEKDKFMQAGLAKGLKFGVIGSGDDHTGHPGHSNPGGYPNGLVSFLAPSLTRESIWDAFWNRRVYATSFERIYVEFTIDGRLMGESIGITAPCRIKYTVLTQTDNADVFLIRDNVEIRTDQTSNGVVEASFEDDPPMGDHFYYLRVVQSNGERAWSTPIWVSHKTSSVPAWLSLTPQ